MDVYEVSIPQAVSTIAIKLPVGKAAKLLTVSIPQAVSTIAIATYLANKNIAYLTCFNTASGKYYCNSSRMAGRTSGHSKFQYRKR